MIEIKDLKKRFSDTGPWITDGVNLTIPDGKFTCIIGRSGEGKSVLLKQIIGLIRPTSGSVLIDGIDISSLKNYQLQTVFRKIGYVFQSAALLDSLNVLENIGLPLVEHGVAKKDIEPLVKEKLLLVDLPEDTLPKYPSELSGGMKKRVGLARTLITNPSIVLYDEPTTGLDPITTRVIHELMASTQKKLHLTSVVISHDPEVFQYVDRVALLQDRKIRCVVEDAKTIWDSKDPYIYQFIRGLTEGPIPLEKE